MFLQVAAHGKGKRKVPAISLSSSRSQVGRGSTLPLPPHPINTCLLVPPSSSQVGRELPQPLPEGPDKKDRKKDQSGSWPLQRQLE